MKIAISGPLLPAKEQSLAGWQPKLLSDTWILGLSFASVRSHLKQGG